MADLMSALDPTQDWPSVLTVTPAADIATEFLTKARALINQPNGWQNFTDSLPATAYRVLFRLNDRQGELFFYMHSQMLARYDAERLSNGMGQVQPFSPDLFGKPIPGEYTPNIPPYTKRRADQTLKQGDVDSLHRMQDALSTAVADGQLLRA